MLLLGWERDVVSSSTSSKLHAKVRDDRRDEAYANLKIVHQRNAPARNTTDSSWEENHPQLHMHTVNAVVSASPAAESQWTPDAFELGEHTGTV